MDAALEGQPAEAFPPPGPACARKGAFITENGRVSSIDGLFPGDTVPTTTPPSVVINTTTSTTATTLPTTTVPTVPEP
jgi:hypothetical protein